MKAAANGRMPADIYQHFVRALFDGKGLLAAGMVSHVATGVLIWSKLGDPFYLYCACAIFVVWLARTIHRRSLDLGPEVQRSYEEIAYWERSYIVTSGSVALILGLMSSYSILVSRDSFAELTSVCVTLGTLVSAVGRNYASKRVVDVICLAACLPIVVGLFLLRDVYSAALGCLIFPYFFMIQKMSRHVRQFLYTNVLSRREISIIADRFDAALNNMPHGLFMLDAKNRVLVSNRRASQLLKISSRLSLRDHSLKAVLRFGVMRGVLSSESARLIESQLSALIMGAESRALIRFSEELYLEFTAKRRRDEGAVLIFEDVTARIRAEEKIIHMARYDSLTGLPNRAFFAETVAGLIKLMPAEEMVAVAVFDIDEFKHVNDTNGHMTGDRLLCALASRFGEVCPDRLTLSRFGGDEFVVFVRDVTGKEDLDDVMRRIHDTISGRYFVNGNRLFVEVSGGVVMGQAGGFRLDTMQIKADLALYKTKQDKANAWTIFADDMDAEYVRRQRLKADLRGAISGGGLTTVYQPMFSPHDMTIACCEALSRWKHPELGPISPAIFIELAEEMGVVGELTRQIMHSACRDCMSWGGDTGVSVNLSALDLRNQDILSMVRDALKTTGLPARRLQVEVTESAFVKDSMKAQAILRELRAMGLVVAIDDFGTGYSSLSYLNTLPLDKVKIDRSFVADITSNERQLKLLRGIVHMSRELGLDIVIEGVETEDQLEVLKKADCADLIQGFVFGFPMPTAEIGELLSRTRARPAEKKPQSLTAV